MKQIVTLTLAVFTVVAVVPSKLGAGGCRTVYRNAYVAPAVVVKKQVYAAPVYKDYVGYQSTYSTLYLPSYYGQEQKAEYTKERQQQQQINIELLKSLNLLQLQLQQRGYQSPQFDPSKQKGVEQIPPPRSPGVPYPPMPPADRDPRQQPPRSDPEHPFLQYARQRCIRCHTAGSEKGSFAMFDQTGRALTPTCEQAIEILRQMKSGHMPQGGPKPTDQEYSQAVDYVTTVNLQRK